MRARPFLVSVGLLAAAFAGCIDEPDGSVSVYVTAEHGSSLAEVQLNLSTVHLRKAGSEAPNETDVLKSDRFPENWVEVELAPAEVAMTFATNASDEAVFFGEGPIPVRDYDGVGVLVEAASGENRNGTPVDIKVTDEVTDVRTNVSVTAANETRILLTVDLNQSLDRGEREAEGWLFTPRFSDVSATHVEDGAWGTERHDPGERVNLTG